MTTNHPSNSSTPGREPDTHVVAWVPFTLLGHLGVVQVVAEPQYCDHGEATHLRLSLEGMVHRSSWDGLCLDDGSGHP